MDSRTISMACLTGGTSQDVAISTASAQSAAITFIRGSGTIVLTVDTACYMRQGANPTAVSDGTDQYVPANIPLRITDVQTGWKIAFKTPSGTGTAHITPEVPL